MENCLLKVAFVFLWHVSVNVLLIWESVHFKWSDNNTVKFKYIQFSSAKCLVSTENLKLSIVSS